MKNPTMLFLLAILTLVSLHAQETDYLPAFPQAEGFGAYSLGGRSGKVIFVDNLNNDGPHDVIDRVDQTEGWPEQQSAYCPVMN